MHLGFAYFQIFEIRKHLPFATRQGPERLTVVISDGHPLRSRKVIFKGRVIPII